MATNYLYRYADGTTGNSAFQRGANGQIITNPAGGVTEGAFLGQQNANGGYSPGLNVGYEGYGLASQGTQGQPLNGATFGGASNSGNQGFGQINIAQNPAAGNMAAPSGGFGTMQPNGSVQVGGAPTFGGSTGAPGMGSGSTSQFGQLSGQPGINGLSGGYTLNPFLDQMANAQTTQATNAFNRVTLPGIASSAVASGGYGGSRQGVIEANALNDLNTNINSGLANLYSNGYGQSINYDLGRLNSANSYDLGLRSNELGQQNLDRNINNDNKGWQLQGANFGLGLYNTLNQNNQTALNAGNAIQNTPMNYWQQFANTANGLGNGFGTTNTSGSTSGNPLLGALGGAQLGSQFGNIFK